MTISKMRPLIILFTLIVSSKCGPATESFKDQYCTDPRTMRKHQAYTEWADAYSCTRHRCQPGGRNLAIYTVGCKRVEAPESAIECEEVVEDTNMQFPYCCTRLRCLVVVRGEVWTRVLGQPWETLPAAPWSHMYKMKKPPPVDGSFLPKNLSQGPVYELAPESQNTATNDQILRSSKKTTADCNDKISPRASVPAPDIVIALSTKNEKKRGKIRHKKTKNTYDAKYEDDILENANEIEADESIAKERAQELDSDEKQSAGADSATLRPSKSRSEVPANQQPWANIPQNQWDGQEPSMDADNPLPDFTSPEIKIDERSPEESAHPNLQALVDAIGSRMKDIENVVQKMSDRVHIVKPEETEYGSSEKKSEYDSKTHQPRDSGERSKHNVKKIKKPNPDGNHYKRFSVKSRGSKYLHSSVDSTTELPLFIEDNNLNGYFSDASNNILRRSNSPKEPVSIYMAPVDARRKSHTQNVVKATDSEDNEKKHKKHSHKKKRSKNGKTHKKHHSKGEKKKKFNKVTSLESDKNIISLEETNALATN